MIFDNSFWALIGLIAFLLLMIYFKVPTMLSKALGERGARIARELEEARRLREEAQQVLAEYQKRRLKAEEEAREIIASAKRQAQAMIADMRLETENYIARRNETAEQRITQIESEAIDFIRSAAIDKAALAAETVLKNNLKTEENMGDRIFKQSLLDVKAGLKKIS